MSQTMIDRTYWLIDWSYRKMLLLTEDLTEEQFCWRPGPEAPPVGWHLWHMARFADMLQARFPDGQNGPVRQIWDEEDLALRWELDTSELGPLQGGIGMEHEPAATLPHHVGQGPILDYARRCFAACEGLADRLTPEELDQDRPNPFGYKITEDGRVVAVPGQVTQPGDSLAWHLSHISRHLGMIEGLCGVLELDGTATV